MATALSVTVMIVALAIITGFKYSVSDKLYSFAGHVHVVPFDETRSNSLTYSDPVYLDRTLIGSIRRIPQVASVHPFAVRPVIVQAHGGMEGLQLKGIDKDYRFLQGISVTGGSIDYSDSGYAKQVLLSKTTADRLSVNMGDTVQVNFVEAGTPRIRRLKVVGFFHSGMEEVDKFYGICDLRLLQRMNNWTADSVNGFQVNLTDPKYADTVANYIHYNLVAAPLEAYTTRENYAPIFDWLNVTGINSTILLVIMAIVAIINLASVLLILMVDRARMIGLLKALGMPFEDTRNIFLSISALIGGLGILLGNALALGLCWLQVKYGIITLPEETYYMKYAPVKIIWWQVALIDVATLALCVFCMWLPALYIRRIQPAKVLQFK